MIFRRLAQNLKDQNWTAICIEFVLLVLGVFLGIQVANWNASRVDDHRAQDYLARIRDDLNSDLTDTQVRGAYWKQVADFGNQAIQHAESGALVEGSAWKTVLAYYQASQIWTWQANDSTYQEMLNAGELGLIKDQSIRVRLAVYYGSADKRSDYLYLLIPEYRKIVRGMTPKVVSDQIWSQCVQNPPDGIQRLVDCASPMTEAEAQKVLQGYASNPQLLAELRFWVANQGVVMVMLPLRHSRARDLLTLLQTEKSP